MVRADPCLSPGAHTHSPCRSVLTPPLPRDQTLLDYFKNYRRHHDLLHRKPDESISRYKTQDDMRYKHSKDPSNPGKFVSFSTTQLSIGAARIQFMRTLRVPDDSSNYLLPPVRALNFQSEEMPHPLTRVLAPFLFNPCLSTSQRSLRRFELVEDTLWCFSGFLSEFKPRSERE
jgi:hypothetical protein